MIIGASMALLLMQYNFMSNYLSEIINETLTLFKSAKSSIGTQLFI
jgi:hypothetical protein